MAPNDELKSYATSTTDFYELLSLPATFAQKDLERAKRLTSFKYHPDKAGTGDHAREQLHLTNVGYEILNDPALRALYDNARSARERKKASEAYLEAGRRKLKDELEAREAAGRGHDLGAARGGKVDEKAMRLRWLAEDGRRRREELQARREREAEEEARRERQVEAKVQADLQGVVPGRRKIRSEAQFVGNPFALGPNGEPSLEERTMQRLREAAQRQRVVGEAR